MSETGVVNQEFSSERTITQHDLDEFARLSGDDNPIHVDAAYAATTPFVRPVAHGMYLFALVRAQLRRHWPVAQLSEQRLQFMAPTPVGSVVTITLKVIGTEIDAVRISTTVASQDGSIGLVGDCVLVPSPGSGQ